ncbi:MAG: hypothetical protein E6343_12935 [Clostridium perfringens]|nr:hypothetical protein [Clostridium perfringens]
MEFLFILFMIIYIIAIPLGLVTYIFSGLALYKAAKLEGDNRKWLAWIPVINNYLLFKLGNKNPNYMWLSIINMPIIFVLNLLLNNEADFNLTLSTLLLIIMLGISIWIIVITIQSFLYISTKYDISAVWFILGLFIPVFSLVAYIIWFNKLRKLEKEENDKEIFEIE